MKNTNFANVLSDELQARLEARLKEASKYAIKAFNGDEPVWHAENYSYKVRSVEDLYEQFDSEWAEIAKLKEQKDMSNSSAERKLLQDRIDNIIKSIVEKMKAMAANHRPFVVTRAATIISNLRGSIMSRALGVNPGELTDSIVTVTHDAVNRLNGMTKKSWLKEEFAMTVHDVLVDNGVHIIDKVLDDGTSIEIPYTFNTATSSQLKEGKCYCIHNSSWAKLVEYFDLHIETRVSAALGADYLKWYAPLWTPCAPLLDQFNHGFSMENVILFKDITMTKIGEHGITFDKRWVAAFQDFIKIKQTVMDGGLLSIVSDDFPEFQERAGMPWINTMKAMLANGWRAFWLTIEKYGISLEDEIPVETVDGRHLKVKDLIGKVVGFESTWKNKKVQNCTFAEGAELLKKMAPDFPHANELFVVRFANEQGSEDDAELDEDGYRKMSRQSVQQFITAKSNKLVAWLTSSIHYVSKFTNAKKFAKTYQKDDLVGDLFRWYPALAGCTQAMYRAESRYVTEFHKVAAGKVRVKGQYPYIMTDASAVFEMILLGKMPEEVEGIIPANCISYRKFKIGDKLFVVRYPANHLVGDVVTNIASFVYGNSSVCWLSNADLLLIRMDGDVDGDEILVTNDPLVIEMFEELKSRVPVYVIDFEHGHAEPVDVRLVGKSIKMALYNGQKWNKVGRYSNLATKILSTIFEGVTTRKQLRQIMLDAASAHVATILSIDAVKTGSIPSDLIRILEGDGVRSGLVDFYKLLPWNQRFTEGIRNVWTNPGWDDEEQYAPESNCVCDRLARMFINLMGIHNNEIRDELNKERDSIPSNFVYDDTEVEEFDYRVLMYSPDKKLQCNSGVVNDEMLSRLDENIYGDYPVVAEIKGGKKVKPAELYRFFFENAAALKRALINKPEADDIMEAYYAFVKDAMISLDPRNTRFVVADHFLRDALEIGKKSNHACWKKDATPLDIRMYKGKYWDFTLHVFAEEYRDNLIRNGYKDMYELVHPNAVENDEEIDPEDLPF